jgi:hypothetical protein
MKKMETKSLNTPEEVRTFDKGKLELIKIGGAIIGRATFQPGWRWSESVKPLVKTKSCEAPHFQYHVSGTLRIKMDVRQGMYHSCQWDMTPGLLERNLWWSSIFKGWLITQMHWQKNNRNDIMPS